MLSYLPNSIAQKAMSYYFVALALVSMAFFRQILPFYMMLFGVVEVCAFFYFGHHLTRQWHKLSEKAFVKRLFWTSLIIRLVYMVFAYFFYNAMTGSPFMFSSADEHVYYNVSKIWREHGWEVFRATMRPYGIEDAGEMYLMGFLCKVFGPYIFVARIAHSILSTLTCVFIYRLANRHFGASVARMAAIFCMLMPNLIYYCGLHLKEADMVFCTVLFVDCVDVVLSEKKLGIKNLLLALFAGFAMFAFRTVLGAVGMVAIGVAVAFNKGKIGAWWKRILLVIMVVVSLGFTSIGMSIMSEVDTAWSRRESNQETGMMARAQSIGGNTYAKYAGAAVFAPFIFTIPFPTMLFVNGQQNQQMLHGGNYVKNVMSGFTIFALVMLLISGEWRKHTLPIAMMVGYLGVIAFSNFAHSERFHQPALPFELMFAAYGISILQKKHFKIVDYWLILMVVAALAWAWFKLAGRGLI